MKVTLATECLGLGHYVTKVQEFGGIVASGRSAAESEKLAMKRVQEAVRNGFRPDYTIRQEPVS